jgi:hypothetical protein
VKAPTEKPANGSPKNLRAVVCDRAKRNSLEFRFIEYFFGGAKELQTN